MATASDCSDFDIASSDSEAENGPDDAILNHGVNFNSSDDDSDDDFLGFQPDWILDSANFQERRMPNFTKTAGSAYAHPEIYSALDYFELLWTDEVYTSICC